MAQDGYFQPEAYPVKGKTRSGPLIDVKEVPWLVLYAIYDVAPTASAAIHGMLITAARLPMKYRKPPIACLCCYPTTAIPPCPG